MARILVIEDEPGLREDLVLELEDAGHVVRCAADGRAAIAALSEGGHALVLCDVQVPLADGLEILGFAAGLPDDRRPRFIMLTAYSDAALHARCKALGVAAVLTKPVDYRHLLDRVAQETAP